MCALWLMFVINTQTSAHVAAGTVLLSEQPFALVPVVASVCSECLRHSSTPVTCARCRTCYCSSACRITALEVGALQSTIKSPILDPTSA